MTEMVDLTPGRIVIRRPDNSIVMDTDTRMPARLGSISLTNVSVEFPITDGEYNEVLLPSTNIRHRMYQTQRADQQVLAAYPSAVAPQFFWCRVKITDSVRGSIAGVDMPQRSPRGQWIPWIGSLLLEVYGNYLIRHINLIVTGGNIVLEKRQSTIFKETVFSSSFGGGSTRSVVLLDLDLSWGIFDA